MGPPAITACRRVPIPPFWNFVETTGRPWVPSRRAPLPPGPIPLAPPISCLRPLFLTVPAGQARNVNAAPNLPAILGQAELNGQWPPPSVVLALIGIVRIRRCTDASKVFIASVRPLSCTCIVRLTLYSLLATLVFASDGALSSTLLFIVDVDICLLSVRPCFWFFWG
jgi:hypothetical protein